VPNAIGERISDDVARDAEFVREFGEYWSHFLGDRLVFVRLEYGGCVRRGVSMRNMVGTIQGIAIKIVQRIIRSGIYSRGIIQCT
jgi:hypothetical protein